MEVNNMDPTEIIAYSAALAAIITAIATSVLAYYNRETLKSVESQVDLIREQASAMKDQVGAMEKQSSLMLENMEYDRVIKKYERVNMEMAQLVGPLFARRRDPNIFSLKVKRSGRIFVSPTARVPDPNPDALIYDFVSFWDSIDQNMYLNRSSILLKAIKDFSEKINKYHEFLSSGKEMEAKYELKGFEESFKVYLIKVIEIRYDEITKEIAEIEEELKFKKKPQ